MADQKTLIFAWLDALRSGEWKQTRGDLENHIGACCLGVACRVAMRAGFSLTARPNSDGVVTFDDGNDVDDLELPLGVKNVFGLKTSGGKYSENPNRWIARDNDNGVPFPEIADIIEANAATLFTNGEQVARWFAERKASPTP